MTADQNAVVLVMDRQDEDVKLITSILEKAGFYVAHFSAGGDAVEWCRAVAASIQLVIIDSATPGIEAPQLVEKFRQIDPEIRILMMAEGQAANLSRGAYPANVKARLSRPFRRARLLGSVLEAARQPLSRTA